MSEPRENAKRTGTRKHVPAVKIGSLDEGVLLYPNKIGLTGHEEIVNPL